MSKLLSNFAVNFNRIKQFEVDKSIKLRPSQKRTLKDLYKYLMYAGKGDLNGYIQMPTGSGKTFIIGLITMLLSTPEINSKSESKKNDKTNFKTLILVHNSSALRQEKERLLDMGLFKESDIGIVGDGSDKQDRKITISTFQSLKKHQDQKYDLIQLDEAHKELGYHTQKNLTKLTNIEKDLQGFSTDKTFIIGLTATPILSRKEVSDYYENKISKTSYSESVKEGTVVPFKFHHADGYFTKEDVNKKDITLEEEIKLLDRNKAYVNLLTKFTELKETSVSKPYPLVFCATIDECDKFQDVAKTHGYKVAIIHSESDVEIKEAELKMKNDEVDIVVSVGKLTEGYDNKLIDTIIIARASNSPAILQQMAGRGSRTNKLGKKFCNIIEINWLDRDYEYYKNFGPGSNGNDSKNTDDKLRLQIGGSRKPMTVAEAFYIDGDEDFGVVAENASNFKVEDIADFRFNYKKILSLKDIELNNWKLKH